MTNEVLYIILIFLILTDIYLTFFGNYSFFFCKKEDDRVDREEEEKNQTILWSIEYGKVLATSLSRNSSRFKGYASAIELMCFLMEDSEIDSLFPSGTIDMKTMPNIFEVYHTEDDLEIVLDEEITKEEQYLWLTQLYFNNIRVKVLEDSLKMS